MTEQPGDQQKSIPLSVRGLAEQLIAAANQLAASAVGEAKDASRLASHDEWAAISAALLEQNQGPLSEQAVRSLLRELQSGVQALISPARVAYLGPEQSYSHLAAIEHFGQSHDLVPVPSIAATFEEVVAGRTDFGIVPIENSTDGRIVDTLDMFARTTAKICGEVQLRIQHNLLGNCQRSDIREVCSKPQALSQCRGWLAKHLPNVKTVEMTSTAAAAERAAKEPGVAAVASRQAGTMYGLQTIVPNIEDNRHNVTRFAVIGDSETSPTGQDKTSLMFEIAHQPGALADIMLIFKNCRLNMTWIESFPMPAAPNEYLFFVEVEGHVTEAAIQRALASLQEKTVDLNVLGSYPKGEIVA